MKRNSCHGKKVVCAALTALLMIGAMAQPALAVQSGTAANTVLRGEYVMVINTEANAENKQSTGVLVFDAGDASAASATVPAPMMVDGEVFAERESDFAQQQQATADAAKGRMAKVYQKGDKKTFYDNKRFVCVGAGQHCYVWMEEGLHTGYEAAGKTEAAAAEIAFVYDGEPYQILSEMASKAGGIPYLDGAGKLSILLEQTDSSSGYYGGEPDITAIHINAPEGSRYAPGNFAGRNGLFVHEGQHALFRLLTCGKSGELAASMSWLNEGLAVAAMDYTWDGDDPNGWMTYINGDSDLRAGAPLFYRSYRNSTALDYGIQYAFVRYLSNRLAGGRYDPLPFLKNVYATSAVNKTPEAYINALIKACDPNASLTFADALTGFYVALGAQEPDGMYGFGTDTTVRRRVTDYPVYLGESGKSVQLAGTGALLLKTKDGSFTVPQGAGKSIRFVAFDKSTPSKPAQGEGTAAKPYQIASAKDIRFLTLYPEANFVLTANIDMASGDAHMPPDAFGGVLDGRGYKLTNVNTPLMSKNNGLVKDLAVEANLSDEYTYNIGVIAKENNGTILGCHVKLSANARLIGGNMVLPNQFGAIAGENTNVGRVERCAAQVTAVLKASTNHARIGGLVGLNQGVVTNSYATGSIGVSQNPTERSLYVGGAVGSLEAAIFPGAGVKNVYSTVAVNVSAQAQSSAVGTLFGLFNARRKPTVENCFAEMQGALAPVGDGDATQNAVFARTAQQLLQQATYTDWPFGGVWKMATGGTPVLVGTNDVTSLVPQVGKKTYFVGEAINLYGSRLLVNDIPIELTEDMLAAPFDSATPGTKTLQGSYFGKEFSFAVTVKAPASVENLVVYKAPRTSYSEGMRFSMAGAVLRATLDGVANCYLYSGFTHDKQDSLTAADSAVTLTYCGVGVQQPISVTGKIPTGLILAQAPETVSYTQGNLLNLAGLRLQISYNDGSVSPVFGVDALKQYDVRFTLVSKKEGGGFEISPIADVTAHKLSSTDSGKMLYAQIGAAAPDQNPAAALVATLSVGSLLKMDDPIYDVPVWDGRVKPDGNPTDDSNAEYTYSPAVTGGKPPYTCKLNGVLPTGVKQISTAAYEGDVFRHRIAISTPGTYFMPYTITDTAGNSLEVNFVIRVSPPLSDCRLLGMSVAERWGAQQYPCVVDEEAKTVSVTLPESMRGSGLVMQQPVCAQGAEISPVNGGNLYEAGAYKDILVTAQDKVTQQAYKLLVNFSSPEAVELPKPDGLVWNGNTAVWNAVEGASGYLVGVCIFNESAYPPHAVYTVKDTTQLDLSLDCISTSQHQFTVIALGDGATKLNSAAAQSPLQVPLPTVTSVQVTPAETNVYRGQSKAFSASVSGFGSPNKGVEWRVEGAQSPSTSISAAGVLSVAADELAEQLSVVARSVVTPQREGIARVTLQTLQPLAAPQNLRWSWTNDANRRVQTAQAQWNAVAQPGLSGYIVTLLKDGLPLSAPLRVAANTTSCNFTNEVAGSGTYTFSVVALGNGLSAGNSIPSVSPEQGYETPCIVTGVSIALPAEKTVYRGESVSLGASVAGTNNPSQRVRWAVTQQMTEGTVIDEDTGVLTIAQGETNTQVTVRAASLEDTSKYADVQLSIATKGAQPLAAPENLRWEGETAVWDAVENAAGYAVALWLEDFGEVAPAQIVSIPRMDFAGKFSKTGSYFYRVTAMANPLTHNDSAVAQSGAYVYESPMRVESVTVRPYSTMLAPGDTKRFTARVNGANQPPQQVVWSVEGALHAQTHIDSATGELSVALQETASALTVRAASTFDETKSGTAAVAVSTGEQPTQGVTLAVPEQVQPDARGIYHIASNEELPLVLGFLPATSEENKQVVFEVLPAEGIAEANENAVIVRQNEDGTAALTARQAGAAEVRVALQDGTMSEDTVTVQVHNVPSELTVQRLSGETAQELRFDAAGAEYKAVPGFVPASDLDADAPRELAWKSENPAVVRVVVQPDSGAARIIAVAPGRASVTAQAYNGKSVTWLCTVQPLAASVRLARLAFVPVDTLGASNLPQTGRCLRAQLYTDTGALVSENAYELIRVSGAAAVDDATKTLTVGTVSTKSTVTVKAVLKNDAQKRSVTLKLSVYPKQAETGVLTVTPIFPITEESCAVEKNQMGSATKIVFENGVPVAPARGNAHAQIAPAYTDCAGAPLPNVRTTYASSNTAVATVDAAGRLVIKGKGTCVITATAADVTKLVQRVTVAVADYTPRVPKSAVSFNFAKEGMLRVALLEAQGSTIESVELYRDAACTLPDMRFDAVWDDAPADGADPAMVLTSLDQKAYSNVKTYVKARVRIGQPQQDGAVREQNEVVPLTVTAVRSIPAPTIAMQGVCQLLRLDAPEAQLILKKLPTGHSVVRAELAMPNGGPQYITLEAGNEQNTQFTFNASAAREYLAQNQEASAASIGKTYLLRVWYKGYALPYEKTIVVPTGTAVPAVRAATQAAGLNISVGYRDMPLRMTLDGKALDCTALTVEKATVGRSDYTDSVLTKKNERDAAFPWSLSLGEGASPTGTMSINMRVESDALVRPVSVRTSLVLRNTPIAPRLSTTTAAVNRLEPLAGRASVTIYVPDMPGFVFDPDGMEVVPETAAAKGKVHFETIKQDGALAVYAQQDAPPGTYTYRVSAYADDDVQGTTDGKQLPYVRLTVRVSATAPGLAFEDDAAKGKLTASIALEKTGAARTLTPRVKFTSTAFSQKLFEDAPLTVVPCNSKGVPMAQTNTMPQAEYDAQAMQLRIGASNSTLKGTYYYLVQGAVGAHDDDAYRTDVKAVLRVAVTDATPSVSYTATSGRIDFAQKTKTAGITPKPLSSSAAARFGALLAGETRVEAVSRPQTANENDILWEVDSTTGKMTFRPKAGADGAPAAPLGTYRFKITPVLSGKLADGSYLCAKPFTYTLTVERRTLSSVPKAATLTLNRTDVQPKAQTQLTSPATLGGAGVGGYEEALRYSLLDSRGRPIANPSYAVPQLSLTKEGVLSAQAVANLAVGTYRFSVNPVLVHEDTTKYDLKAFVLTVRVVDAAPRLSAGASTLRINTHADTASPLAVAHIKGVQAYGALQADETNAAIVVTPPRGGSAADLRCSVALTASGDVQLTAEAVNALKGSYRVAVTPFVARESAVWGEQEQYQLPTVRFTVAPTGAKATVRIQAAKSMGLNLRKQTGTVITLALQNSNAPITKAQIAENPRFAYEAVEYLPDGTARMYVYAKENVAWRSPQKTALQFVVRQQASANTSLLPLTAYSVTPREYKATIKASAQGGTVLYKTPAPNARNEVRMRLSVPYATVEGTKTPFVRISTERMTADQKAAFLLGATDKNGVFRVGAVTEDGSFCVRLAEGARIKPGTTVSLLLLAQTQDSSAQGGAAFTVTVRVLS